MKKPRKYELSYGEVGRLQTVVDFVEFCQKKGCEIPKTTDRRFEDLLLDYVDHFREEQMEYVRKLREERSRGNDGQPSRVQAPR